MAEQTGEIPPRQIPEPAKPVERTVPSAVESTQGRASPLDDTESQRQAAELMNMLKNQSNPELSDLQPQTEPVEAQKKKNLFSSIFQIIKNIFHLLTLGIFRKKMK